MQRRRLLCIDTSSTSSTLELLEAHAVARGVPSTLRRIAVVGGTELAISIGDRLEVLASADRLAVLVTSLSAAHRGIALIDSLSITIPERRECALAVRALLAETISRWDEIYEQYPHVALDELRRTEPQARLLLGLSTPAYDAPRQVLYAATTGHAGAEPILWSADRACFVVMPGMALSSAAATESRTESVLANCDLGCDPGCFDLLSLADALDCDPGCF